MEHALDAVCERLNLLLGLKHRELRRLHDASLNETQTEIVVVLVLLRFPNPAADLRNLLDERQKYNGVGYVEACVECCKRETQANCALLCGVRVESDE